MLIIYDWTTIQLKEYFQVNEERKKAYMLAEEHNAESQRLKDEFTEKINTLTTSYDLKIKDYERRLEVALGRILIYNFQLPLQYSRHSVFPYSYKHDCNSLSSEMIRYISFARKNFQIRHC